MRNSQFTIARILRTLCVLSLAIASSSAGAATLDRIRDAGRIKFGYLPDAAPFTYRNGSGAAEGYGVGLCERVAQQVQGELGLSELAVDWVPVATADRLDQLQSGNIDLLCTPLSVTLNRRREISYSIPVFPGGARAVMRADAPVALREALNETRTPRPVWRGSPAAKTLSNTRVAVTSGTTTENWLVGRIAAFQIGATVVPVPDYKTGLQQVLDRKVDVFFGDRFGIQSAMAPASIRDFNVLDRVFTRELYALPLARGDEDFSLVVDRALSLLYASGEIDTLYAKSFGQPDDAVRTFFQWNAMTQ